MAGLRRLSAAFLRHRAEAAELYPRVAGVTWRPTWAAGRRGRQFAFFDTDTWQIGLSPRLVDEPLHRVNGILRHEFGHAIDELYADSTLQRDIGADLPATLEARADVIAGSIWGPIWYDDDAVQTTRYGSLRPQWLPS